MTFDKHNHLDVLKAILAEELKLDLDTFDVSGGTALTDGGLDLDSVKLMELITAVEERFGFRFDDEDLRPATFESLDALAQAIEKRRADRT
jgi:acyl carrier protein